MQERCVSTFLEFADRDPLVKVSLGIVFNDWSPYGRADRAILPFAGERVARQCESIKLGRVQTLSFPAVPP